MPERQEVYKMILKMRGAEKNVLRGARLRNTQRPLYVLVNMGNNRVAFGRAADLFNLKAREQIQNGGKRTYAIDEILSGEVSSQTVNSLKNPNWQVIQVREGEIARSFRAKKEPLPNALAKARQGETQPIRATLVSNGFLGRPIMVYLETK
jgi:hypothetical protein